MISAVIMDCDAKARKTLVKTLKAQYKDVHVAAEAETLTSARGAINSFAPQLLFVEASATGVLLAEEYSTSSMQFVVLTKEHETMSASFEFTYPNVTGFLRKPFDGSILQRCMERVRNSLMLKVVERWLDEQICHTFSMQSSDLHRTALTASVSASLALPRFSVATAKGDVIVKTEEILYCTAEDDYTEITCLHADKSVKKYLDSKSLKVWEERLTEYDFMRVHKSHVVNLNAVQSVETCGKDGMITLQTGSKIAVSRTYKAALTQAL